MASPTVQVNVRLEPGLYAQVKKAAIRDHATMTEIVTAALTLYIKENK